MIAIVVSRADEASERIGSRLLDCRDWTARDDGARPDVEGGGRYHVAPGFELRTFDDLHIHLDDPVPAFDADPDLVVFVSRHSGETGPLLSTHFTGNFGAAEFGGDDRSLARAAPNAGAVLLSALDDHAPEGYEVATECTHHGPTAVSAPSLFAELGSDEPQWRDDEGALAVARAVLELDGVAPDRDRQLVGFGGGHYAPRFGRVTRETGWAVGHVAADWALDDMGPPSEAADVLERAFEASDAEHALFEAERPALRDAVESLGYRVVTETWARETDGVDLDVVDAVESTLGSVDDGVRFGERASVGDPDEGYAVVDLPDDIVGAAWGVDEDAARAAVREHVVAHETTEGASRPAGRALVGGERAADALVDALADVLAGKYDEVERADGAVVARAVGFDPSKAATLGIPEGPKFGKLAAGRPVEVDGERIEPAVVESEQEERFPVGLAVRRPSDAEGKDN